MTASRYRLSVICQSAHLETMARLETAWISLGHLPCQVEAREGLTGERSLARPARLELATSWFVARRSIQLS